MPRHFSTWKMRHVHRVEWKVIGFKQTLQKCKWSPHVTSFFLTGVLFENVQYFQPHTQKLRTLTNPVAEPTAESAQTVPPRLQGALLGDGEEDPQHVSPRVE